MAYTVAGRRIDTAFGTSSGRKQVARLGETGCAVVAIATLLLSAWATIHAQSAADGEDRRTAASAHAGTAIATEPASTMVAAYGGMPHTYPSDFVLKRPGLHDLTVKDVAWEGMPFKSPIYYGVRVARWPDHASFGGMVDFTHAKAISRFADTVELNGTLNGAPAPAKARLGDIFKHLEFSHGHNMLTLNGIYRLPRLGSRLLPYIGAGAGVALPHTEIALLKDDSRTYEYQYAGPVGQALAGIEIRLPRNLTCFIEYKFTLAAYEVPLTHKDGWLAVTDLWQQMQRWLSGTPPVGGTARTRLTSHQLIAGLGVRIGQAAPAAR